MNSLCSTGIGDFCQKESDSWDSFKLLSEIYEFAIARYNDAGVEMLLEALATAEAAVGEMKRERS